MLDIGLSHRSRMLSKQFFQSLHGYSRWLGLIAILFGEDFLSFLHIFDNFILLYEGKLTKKLKRSQILWENIPMTDYKADKKDLSILRLLQQDASSSVEHLAEEVGLSRNACWRRIKLMERAGLIRSRVVILNADKLDLGLMVYVLIRTSDHDPKWISKFRHVINSMPEIMSAHRMSGDLDYVLRVRVGSVKDYDHFYQNLIKGVPISDISASFVMEDIKDTTALPL